MFIRDYVLRRLEEGADDMLALEDEVRRVFPNRVAGYSYLSSIRRRWLDARAAVTPKAEMKA